MNRSFLLFLLISFVGLLIWGFRPKPTAAFIPTNEKNEWQCYTTYSVTNPCYEAFNAIGMYSEDLGWAVRGRTFLRWNGHNWAAQPSLSLAGSAQGFEYLSADEMWVAASSAIHHYDRGNWQTYPISDGHISQLSMLSADEGWGVGTRFWINEKYTSVTHWDGTEWISRTSELPFDAYDVSAVSSNNVWVVGSDGNIANWNGNSFTFVSSPTNSTIQTIEAVSATDIWAGDDDGNILRFNGATWSIFDNIGGSLTSLQMNGESLGYLLSERSTTTGFSWSDIYRWDGNEWQIDGSMGWDFDYRFSGQPNLSLASDGTLRATADENILKRVADASWEAIEQPSIIGSNDVALLSAADGWRVSNGGAIWRLNGDGKWVPQASPTDLDLYSVVALSADDAWAGGDGAFLHWDGSSWTIIDSPTRNRIVKFSALSSNNIWAIANGATLEILHWNGTEWLASPAPEPENYYQDYWDFAMTAPTDGWLALDSHMYRYDGSTWNLVNAQYGYFERLSFSSPTNGWAIRNNALYQWDGISWTIVMADAFEHPVSEIITNADDYVWFVSSRGISHWNGNTVETAHFPYIRGANRWGGSASFTDSQTGWYVGPDGLVRWDGTQWTLETPPPEIRTDSGFADLDATSAENIWAVGSDVARYDGTKWRYVQYNLPHSPEVIAAAAEDDVWGGGLDLLVNWSGTDWVQAVVSTTDQYDVEAIDMVDSENGWAVLNHTNDEDAIYRWLNGSWIPVQSIERSGNFDIGFTIDMLSASYGWAAVDKTLFNWNGNDWTSTPISWTVRGVSLLTETNGWAVADKMILHWDGTQWLEHTPLTNPRMADISMFSADFGIAIGLYGGVYHWDGSEWKETTKPSFWNFNRSVVATGDNEGWMTSSNPLLHLTKKQEPKLTIFLPTIQR